MLLPTLASCKDKTSSDDTTATEAEQTTDTQAEDTKPEEETRVVLKPLFGEASGNYRVVKSDNAELETVASAFLTELKKKTGLRGINLTAPDTAETDKEILIGEIKSRSSSVDGMAATRYIDGRVTFYGDKLVVSAYTAEKLEAALNKLLAAIVEDENGDWCVPSNIDITVKGSMALTVPSFKTSNATYIGAYTSNDNRYQVAYEMPYTREAINEYEAYKARLADEGFTEYSSNMIGKNRFATYVNEKAELHLIWYPSLSQFRIVYASRGYLPEQQTPSYTKLTDATVTQLGRAATAYDAPGESYVIQLEDGSFVLIDGGPGLGASGQQDMAALKDYLYAHKPASHAKPKITWMFTHLHNDHMELALGFLTGYSADVELQTVCYNVPNLDSALEDAHCANNYNKLKALIRDVYEDTNTYIFHAGQKMYLAGCEIEFLYTQEDYWPNNMWTANLTSAVWRMTFKGGNTFLVLGDCEVGNCEQLSAIYGSYLESDVFQLSHHGFNGATLELYQLIDAKICLWACDEERFNNDGRCQGYYATSTDGGHSYTNYPNPSNKTVWEAYRFNYWLRTTQWTQDGANGDRQHYHSSVTTTIRMSDLSVTQG